MIQELFVLLNQPVLAMQLEVYLKLRRSKKSTYQVEWSEVLIYFTEFFTWLES